MMLKEYHKVDINGNRIEVVVLNSDEEIPMNYFQGWGDRTFVNPKWDYSIGDWVESVSDDDILIKAREMKMSELDKACQQSILGYFKATVDGVEYSFSCDFEAQTNFEKVDRAFEKGRMTQINWTAYDANGNVVRVTLDPTSFEPVYLAHLYHIQSNISRLRDVLQPQVEIASEEELKTIVY